MNIKPIYVKCCLALLLIVAMVGCDKAEWVDTTAAYINFYNASEVIQQNAVLMNNNMVFINDSLPNGTFDKFPQFRNLDVSQRQYPYTFSIYNTADIHTPSTYQYVYYMAMQPDKYHFIYTGADKIFLHDTTLNLSVGSHTCLYLVESPEDFAYHIVSVPEEREGIDGKVRVRVVHLSPDTEPVSIRRVYADGSSKDVGYSAVGFGGYTDYIALDTEGTEEQFHNIVLQLSLADAPDDAVLTAAIPADAGSSYIVLLRGFQNPAERNLLRGYDNLGEPVYQQYAVYANLRTALRRTY